MTPAYLPASTQLHSFRASAAGRNRAVGDRHAAGSGWMAKRGPHRRRQVRRGTLGDAFKQRARASEFGRWANGTELTGGQR
jgi:hypothetical protein